MANATNVRSWLKASTLYKPEFGTRELIKEIGDDHGELRNDDFKLFSVHHPFH